MKSNLQAVHEKIAAACAKANRAESDVTLVAVSKLKPIESVMAASDAGQMVFGENYVQEAVDKVAQLPGLQWHFVGTMQTNKIKQTAGKFKLIHSVDREKAAQEISKVSVAAGVVQDILLQIHIGDEASKQGVLFYEAPAIIESILELPNLRLRGLMTLPPLTPDETKARSQFALLRTSLEKWRDKYISHKEKAHFNELSMGTSLDYEWAILEGATLVRIGTSIFGERSET
ncbi:MAG: YggS family pyridoxal phosphate-dependent enzyme [Proteobacteria bacterium]|nr:MAG: YggS family pyridoxal phosphate-dependent enzyme [Pseudomonadota bacterium]